MTSNNANQFLQFRSQLYHEHFNNRNDVQMKLVDAICSNTRARSVVELSLSPYFTHGFSSLYKGVTDYQPEQAKKSLAELAAPYLPAPWKGKFWLLGTDTTAYPRPYAFKLSERESVYKPTPIKGQMPVTYGHDYSQINLLVPRSSQPDPAWTIPLEGRRTRRKDQEQTATAQMQSLLENRNLPFYQAHCIQLGDSHYSTPGYLAAFGDKPNVISITRSRGNRVYYLVAASAGQPRKRGQPPRRGKRLKLNDPLTWPQPDRAVTFPEANRKGKRQWVEVVAWQKVIMPGKWKPVRLPMHKHPFTLVRITVYSDRHEPAYTRPLWLLVMGKERHHLSLQEIYEAFQYRSGMEQFFRFAKQNLLLSKFQTPQTKHEEHWWQIVNLACLQLWVAREYASWLPRPWERHLPQVKEKHLSPTMVQRSFARIIQQFGTPARFPKRRGYSPGRAKGRAPLLRKVPSVLLQRQI